MGRKSKGARLYLDPKRREWILRDGTMFVRTGFKEAETDAAQGALNGYLKKKHYSSRQRLRRDIYFVTCDVDGFPVKIGMSGDVTERMRDIRTALPYPVKLLGTFSGTSKDETAIQAKFRSFKLTGEWFQRTPELMAYIAEVCVSVRDCSDTQNEAVQNVA